MLMDGKGDLFTVSALPVDGRFPSGTTRYEKRAIAVENAVLGPGHLHRLRQVHDRVPHAVIRHEVFLPKRSPVLLRAFCPALPLQGSPRPPHGYRCGRGRLHRLWGLRRRMPREVKTEARHKSINMESALVHRDRLREHWDFLPIDPELDRSLLAHDSVKGSQSLQPLFEFLRAPATAAARRRT